MSTAEETDLVQFLGRTFPSLAALDPAEGLRRAESLGLFTAQIWSAGPAGLAARGVNVPSEVHEILTDAAAISLQMRRNGATFLAKVRELLDDTRFTPFITVVAQHFAKATAGRASSTHTALQAQPDPRLASSATHRALGASSTNTALPTPSTTPPNSAPRTPTAANPAVRATTAANPAVRATTGAMPAPLAEGAPPASPGTQVPPPEGGDGTPVQGTPTGPRKLNEIAGFELVKQLGEGGMGKVFKARQKSLNRFVALKVLSPALARDAEYVERFHREAIAGAALKHPNIVGVIDHGTDAANGVHFVAFDYIDGMTVGGMLNAKKKLPERDALAIVRATASALLCAEQAGIVHRDIKPDNIIVGKDGIPRVIDLGLAKKQNEKSAMTIVGVVMGTPQYMAPEQALGEAEIDSRADIYALGMTLYHIVTGKHAFDAESSTGILMKHITDDCPDPRLVDPTISENTVRIIFKLSAREKPARYQSNAEVLKDIDLVLAGKQPALAPPVGGIGAKPAAAPAPAAGAPGAKRSQVTQALPSAKKDLFSPDEPAWARELHPPNIIDPPAPFEEPADPVDAAIAAYQRTGAPEKIADAIKLLQANAGKGDTAAQAKTDAALAKAYLLKGEKINAETRAKSALDKDPRCQDAADVLGKIARGDADRTKMEAGLTSIREAIVAGKLDEARKLAEKLRDAYSFDPQPLLALAAVVRLMNNESAFIESVRGAWARFPSKERPDVALAGLDGLVADLLVEQGRSVYRGGDPMLLKYTIEGLDEKSNITGGSLRMAIGVARVALERASTPSAGELPPFLQRRLHFASARAFSGLHRYAEATEEIMKAAQLGPTEAERAAFEAEKTFIHNMREKDSAPGAAKPSGKYKCAGLTALLELAKTRLAAAAKEKATRTGEIEKLGPTLANIAKTDSGAKRELRMAAEQLGAKDAFEQLEPLERELAEIARERARASASKPAESSGGGFFSKLKDVAGAAAAGVAGAAKEAQLKLKESQIKTKQEAAIKDLASSFAMELRDYTYTNSKLIPLAKKAAALGTAQDFYVREEGRAKKDIDRLGPLC